MELNITCACGCGKVLGSIRVPEGADDDTVARLTKQATNEYMATECVPTGENA